MRQSGALNFFEYLYMVFLTTANGSYHELASQSRGSQAVKRAFVELHRFANLMSEASTKRFLSAQRQLDRVMQRRL